MDIASLCQTADVQPHYKMQPSPISSQPSPPLRRQSSNQSQASPPPPRLSTQSSSMGINSLLNAAPAVRRSSHSSNPESPDRKSESNESRSTSSSYTETILTQYSEATSPSTKRKASEDVTPHGEPVKKKARVLEKKISQDVPKAVKQESPQIKTLPPRMEKPIWAQSWREHVIAKEGGYQSPRRQVECKTEIKIESKKVTEPVSDFEPSILNAPPPDIIINKISDFVYINTMNPEVSSLITAYQSVALEIEAKLGHVIDRATSRRLVLPVATETVIDRNMHSDFAFESSMTELQHRHLNNYLNGVVQKSLEKSFPNGSQAPPKPRSPIAYTHTKEVDTFCGLAPTGIAKLPPFMRDRRTTPKVRITRLQDKGADDKILAKIIKSRVADFDIHCPESPVDCRISINWEMQYDGAMEDLLPPESVPNERPARQKDRVSYKHQACQIDLTQVTLSANKTAGPQQPPRREHELEIELSVDTAREQASLLRNQKPNSYHSLITAFYNNVRTLARELNNTPGKQPATPNK